MKLIYDRAGQARILSLDLDPRLCDLLERRFADIKTLDGDLTDWTEWLIVEAGDTEADIVREVGFSPLVEPIDGARFPDEGFQPFWDHLARHDGWFELSVSFGSSFAYVMFIHDSADTEPNLLALCREYAA